MIVVSIFCTFGGNSSVSQLYFLWKMAVNNGNVLQTKSLKSLLNIEGRVGMKAQHSIGFHVKKSFITLYHSMFTITDC